MGYSYKEMTPKNKKIMEYVIIGIVISATIIAIGIAIEHIT